MRLDDFSAQLSAIHAVGDLPLESWSPAVCGTLPLRISYNGEWFFDGSPIKRSSLVRLFSRVLWRDANSYSLVTPVEKVMIEVDDVPFVASTLHTVGTDLVVTTTVGDQVVLGEGHPVVVLSRSGDAFIPYVHVRRRLWARCSRAVALLVAELVKETVVDQKLRFGLQAGGVFFPLDDAARLDDLP